MDVTSRWDFTISRATELRPSNEMLMLLHACSAPLLTATLSIDFQLKLKRRLYFWNFRSVIIVESMAGFSQRQVNILRNQLRELKSFYESYRVTTFGMHVEVDVLLTMGKQYVLRVYLPPNFPNSCPSMVVIAPDGILICTSNCENMNSVLFLFR